MIRRLDRDDAVTFRIIRLEGLAAHPTAFGADYADEFAQPLEYFERRLHDARVLGAFENGELVGVIGIRPFAGPKVHHNGQIWGVYIRETYRGGGLSGQLLEAAIAEARGLGLAWLKLSVSSENHTARRLYERHGFTNYGREPAVLRIHGVDHDEDLMALRL